MTVASDKQMSELISLCKRRGFVFASSDIYGGLRSFYDYGPLGVALKRSIAQLWWQCMVEHRDDVVGLESSIIMHSKVWKASGHLEGFSDALVDCKNCKARFRPDQQPRLAVGSPVSWHKILPGGGTVEQHTVVGQRGYVCPQCQSTELSEEREFSGMLRTFLGAVDVVASAQKLQDAQALAAVLEENSVYLRPETAQGMFVQFANVQQSMGMKVPFGIAQQGKSFRNEVTVEHFIFRSCEFEQMEMEFFCEPGSEDRWLEYWCQERLKWYQALAQCPDDFRLRPHDAAELAHYSKACYDIEYRYPWGWAELEGIAIRGDYDLKKHAAASGAKLSYFDPHAVHPQTGKLGRRYVPQVVEPAAGLTRAVLCFLADAHKAGMGANAVGERAQRRNYLKLHPALAPYKAALLPLLQKDTAQCAMAQNLAMDLRQAGLIVSVDLRGSIGKRYARHDEIGTPFALTVDQQSLEDQTITLRDRNTTEQKRMSAEQAQQYIISQCRLQLPPSPFSLSSSTL